MLEVEDGAALPQVRVAEHLRGVEHRAARNPAAGQGPHDLVLVVLHGPALDHRGEIVAVAGLGRRRAEALVGADVLAADGRSGEHTSELQSLAYLVCRLFFLMIRRPPRSTLFP